MNKLYIANSRFLQAAQDLAAFTGQIIICSSMPDDYVFLRLDDDGLAIMTKGFKPLNVHDLYTKLYLRKDQLSRELLIQAVKIKPAPEIQIIDATAGFAKDSVLLGLYGYRVLMLERDPLLATVIYYALQYKLIPADNLELIFANSLDYFKHYTAAPPYAIYLDPMFNAQNKALAKKDMQIIQFLTNDVLPMEAELFNAAWHISKKIIVKRDNKQFPLISTPLPSYSKQGKTIRYDIYIIPKN